MSAGSRAIVRVLGLTAALAMDTRAACNAIPDGESLRVGAATALAAGDPTAPVVAPTPGLVGFKGALGRIDRLHLIPGVTSSFRVQPDGVCVHAVDDELVVQAAPGASTAGLVGVDLVVSVIGTTTDAGEDPRILVLGSKEACDVLHPDPALESGETAARGILRCESLAPGIDGPNVRIRLPDDADGLVVGGSPLRGPVTIVVSRRPDSLAGHRALLSRIAKDGCAANCDELRDARSLACVDSFYTVSASGTAVSDPIPCAVTIPGDVATNDFKKRCEDLPSPDPDLQKCDDDRSELQLWEDACGGVHVPFDWTEIRKDVSTSTDVTRRVAGRSATSRTEKGKLSSKPIWVPGREFIGSTPIDDAQGSMATSDWRRPDIDVWYPADSPQELGLRGTTDQPNSIVHVFPRMPVSLACDGVAGDEACMGVEGGGGLSCACRDRYPAGCTCKELDPPRFFACAGGDFDGMPCTRHGHCNSKAGSANPDGTCSRKPTCRQDGKQGVWEAPGAATGTACWVDDTCKQVANHPWCGYRLFDVGDRKDNSSFPDRVELDAEIADGGRARRGVCKGDNGKRMKLCNEQSGHRCVLADCDTDATECECRGYTLQAEGRAP